MPASGLSGLQGLYNSGATFLTTTDPLSGGIKTTWGRYPPALRLLLRRSSAVPRLFHDTNFLTRICRGVLR